MSVIVRAQRSAIGEDQTFILEGFDADLAEAPGIGDDGSEPWRR
jgi:hypothetical protein